MMDTAQKMTFSSKNLFRKLDLVELNEEILKGNFIFCAVKMLVFMQFKLVEIETSTDLAFSFP